MVARPGPFLVITWSLALGVAYAAAQPPAFAATPDPVQVTSLEEGEEIAPFREPVIEETGDPMEEVYQQQLMQQELQELRGIVEELAEQVRQMSAREADRYQDVDRRIEDLRLMLNEVADSGHPGATPATRITGTTTPLDRSDSPDEKALYDTALELIRNRQYDTAITQLQEVIDTYPTGTYAANAYYWLGEVYAALPEPEYEKARQALAQVISFFPDNRKVPDAAFKLGKVHHLMGDCARAEELLRQVIDRYPDKAVAKLAESYLRDKVDCSR